MKKSNSNRPKKTVIDPESQSQITQFNDYRYGIVSSSPRSQIPTSSQHQQHQEQQPAVKPQAPLSTPSMEKNIYDKISPCDIKTTRTSIMFHGKKIDISSHISSPSPHDSNYHRHHHDQVNKLNHPPVKLLGTSRLLFNLVLVYIILSHHDHIYDYSSSTLRSIKYSLTPTLEATTLIDHFHNDHVMAETMLHNSGLFLLAEAAAAVALECESDIDCDGNGEKICHENKCICNKDRPIESGGICLPMQLLDEPCQAEGQCLGGSHCIDGVCLCAPDSISQLNPSQSIFYCHPKRQLFESCNYDSQCPMNGYCSTTCLCQNGFGPAIVKASPESPEITSCLPIFCNNVSECESTEFYECEDNKCKCLPTHFDPTRSKCYRLGSLLRGLDQSNSTNSSNPNDQLERQSNDLIDQSQDNHQNAFTNFINDLIEATTGRADLFWLLIVLVFLTLLFLIAICVGVARRRHRDHDDQQHQQEQQQYHHHHNNNLSRHLLFLPCCWTRHKHQEWDPTDAKAAPPDGAAFLHDDGLNRKNSVNQKSFRRKKNLDTDHESADEFVATDEQTDCVANSKNLQNGQMNGKLCQPVGNHQQAKSKTNDYEVIYFGQAGNNKRPSPNVDHNKLIEESNNLQSDDLLKINPMENLKNNNNNHITNHDHQENGKQNQMTNGFSNKSPLFQKSSQQPQPQNNNNNNFSTKNHPASFDNKLQANGHNFALEQEFAGAKIIVPTNSTLV